MNKKHTHEISNHRKNRFVPPGWITGFIPVILMLSMLMGVTAVTSVQGESLLHAAVPSLKLDTADGVYEIGKPKGRMVVLFFSFPG